MTSCSEHGMKGSGDESSKTQKHLGKMGGGGR